MLYLRVRDAAEKRRDAARRARADGHRAHAVRLGSTAHRGRLGGGRAPGAEPTPRSPTRWRPAPSSSSPGAPTSPSPRGAAASGRWRAALEPCPGATVLPALRRGNVVGALQLGLRPIAGGADDLDRSACWTAAAEGQARLLVLLGADPIADFPDADLARRGAGRRSSIIAVDTFLTDVVAARRRRAGGGRASPRRAGRRRTSRAGSRRWPRRSPSPAPPGPTG